MLPPVLDAQAWKLNNRKTELENLAILKKGSSQKTMSGYLCASFGTVCPEWQHDKECSLYSASVYVSSSSTVQLASCGFTST